MGGRRGLFSVSILSSTSDTFPYTGGELPQMPHSMNHLNCYKPTNQRLLSYTLFARRISVWRILMSWKVSFPFSNLSKRWMACLDLPLLSPEGKIFLIFKNKYWLFGSSKFYRRIFLARIARHGGNVSLIEFQTLFGIVFVSLPTNNQIKSIGEFLCNFKSCPF